MKAFGYWGKAQGGWHLLPFHVLDVAACCVELLQTPARFRSALIELTGLGIDRLLPLFGWACALHDLGKLSPEFQWKVPQVAERLGRRRPRSTRRDPVRHDALGWVLWFERGGTWLGWSPEDMECAHVLMRCATGHHGAPPSRRDGARTLRAGDFFESEEMEAAQEWVRFATEFFVPDLSGVDLRRLRAASWWIAGLVTLVDWLGSSTDWFPYVEGPMDLRDYWERSRRQARQAIAESGLASAGTRRGFGELFAGYAPTSTQSIVAALPTEESFFLAIEDVTGSGKTEAALAAAGGDQYFFGLPTMATANGLWARVASLGGQQTLIHGKRWLLPSAMQRAEQWLNDSSRRAMLAKAGVGTVDQAMLACLYTRFSTLRLLGLAGRTLIVDEVHAYDPYMKQILEVLVELHARSGGSVVLASATLPRQHLQDYAGAWARGRKGSPPRFEASQFPLLSFANGAREEQHFPHAGREAEVIVQRESDIELVVARLIENARRGCCAVWIRNTVAEAIEAFEVLSSAWPATDLFHARFALHDRLEIEGQVMRRFGKDSGPAEREGRILIATQVVEQSLDLDFDLMVSDLAPIDLLIQRAGRLHRHQRGPRGDPVLVVFSPLWTERPDEQWIGGWSRGTSRVYPDHGRLWLGLKQLGTHLRIPHDTRRLIESVYGENTEASIPLGLARVSQRATTSAARAMAQGGLNAIRPSAAYEAEGTPQWDEERAPTRLGEPSREWVLVKAEAPLYGTVEASVVSLRASLLATAPGNPRVRMGPWQTALDVTSMPTPGVRPGGTPVSITYDRRIGLRLR